MSWNKWQRFALSLGHMLPYAAYREKLQIPVTSARVKGDQVQARVRASNPPAVSISLGLRFPFAGKNPWQAAYE